SAVHNPSQRRVAIKRITPFDHSMFCLLTLREIELLRHFSHEDIISILDILRPPNFDDFREVYLVQELMETDMQGVRRATGTGHVAHGDPDTYLQVTVGVEQQVGRFGVSRSTFALSKALIARSVR
ncbi:hypothetical protein EXIGLDRAFT_605387, partial [Exidia glandulosa HHB12029]